MDNQECSVYMPPAIVLEMDLETRAGSSLSQIIDALIEE